MDKVVIKEPVENQDFVFVDHPTKHDHYSVKILSKPYADVIYTYANIRVAEIELENGEMAGELKYAFKIEDPGENDAVTLHNDQDFKDYLGRILETIITQYEYRIGDEKIDGETGNYDTK